MLALFDLDGTLLPPPGAERLLIRRLFAAGHVSPLRLGVCAAAIAGRKLRGDRWAQQRSKDYLVGLSLATVEAEARRLARALAERARPTIHRRLREHGARGDRTVLLTGALDLVAEPLGEALGFDEVCATRCVAVDGLFAARPPLRHPFRESKLALAREVAERCGTTLDRCWAYGDSRHDVALLSAVAHPVAVHPDRTLRRLALHRGWPVIEEPAPGTFAAAVAPTGT
jgi:HAD superfamily phosphoserine phosphatase-like hydrolase